MSADSDAIQLRTPAAGGMLNYLLINDAAVLACQQMGRQGLSDSGTVIRATTAKSARTVMRELISWQSIVVVCLAILLILSSTSPLLGERPLIRLLLKEIGFAFVVAVAVWGFFDLAIRRKQRAHTEKQIEDITSNVFFGVLKRDLPDGLIEETRRLVLEADVVRTDFNITYTLQDDTYEIGDGRTADYVALKAVASYKLNCVSTEAKEIRLGIGLPNPIHLGLQEKVDVHSIRYKFEPGGEWQVPSLDEARSAMRTAMRDETAKFAPCFLEPITLSPGGEVSVVCDYVMAKEVEDTEVLQSQYPSDGLMLNIHDTVPNRRFINARAIHREKLDEHADQEGTHLFRLDCHMVPYQGVVVWWKTRPDEVGREETNSQAVQEVVNDP